VTAGLGGLGEVARGSSDRGGELVTYTIRRRHTGADVHLAGVRTGAGVADGSALAVDDAG
jgi:hypothetical protein